MFTKYKMKIKEPVIIIGCPRSGTSLLFRILSTSPFLWSLYRESNDIWNLFYKKTKKEFKDEVLTAAELEDGVKEFLLNEFHKHALNNYCLGYIAREYLLKNEFLNPGLCIITTFNFLYKNVFLKNYRIVEKTPKNCFRIPFINKLFDDCKFVFIKRDARANINSLIEGWMVKDKYVRGQATNIKLNIKGYSENNGRYWKYVLPPGWESFTDKSLEEVCAFQWTSSNKAALSGLENIEKSRKFFTSYEELTENTFSVIENLCNFINIPFSGEIQKVSGKPPLVNYVTVPYRDKWKKNIDLIKNVYPMIEPMMKELGYKIDD